MLMPREGTTVTKKQQPKDGFDPDTTEEQPLSSLKALIERVEEEVQTLQFGSFSQDDALALGLLIVELATQRELPVAVDIRRGSHVLFHVSLPGATPDNGFWVERKARTAERYAIPSLLVGLRGRLDGGRAEDSGWFDESAYAAHGGSFPIYLRGTGPVATVTVSGLPQKADHELVVEALTKFTRRKR